jgi:hypothetical protein
MVSNMALSRKLTAWFIFLTVSLALACTGHDGVNAKRVFCLNSLKQIAIAYHQYVDTAGEGKYCPPDPKALSDEKHSGELGPALLAAVFRCPSGDSAPAEG